MKKLMFAAAVAASLGVFADGIESQTVGYQAKDVTYGQFNFCAATFIPCSKTGATMTLGDITCKNINYGGSTLSLMTPTGATAKFQHAGLGEEVYATFYYASDADCAEWDDGTVPGWYQVDDEDVLYPMNDFVLPYGTAFNLNAQDLNASVQFAGEVQIGATEISLTYGSFNFTGNVTPVDLNLGDITCKNINYGGSTLSFMTGSGATAKFQHQGLGQEVYSTFYYASAADCAEWDDGTVPGWYQVDDEDVLYPMNTTFELKAGDAINLNCQDLNASLVIPSAL